MMAVPVVVVTLRRGYVIPDTLVAVDGVCATRVMSIPLTVTLVANVSVPLRVGVFGRCSGTVRTPPNTERCAGPDQLTITSIV